MDAVQVPEGFTAFAALLKATKKSTEEEAQEEWTALSRKAREHWEVHERNVGARALGITTPEARDVGLAFTRLRWTRAVDHTSGHVCYEYAVPDTKFSLCTFKQPPGQVAAHLPRIQPDVPASKRFCDYHIFVEAVRGERVSKDVAMSVFKGLCKEEKEPFEVWTMEVRRANTIAFRNFARAVHLAIDEANE